MKHKQAISRVEDVAFLLVFSGNMIFWEIGFLSDIRYLCNQEEFLFVFAVEKKHFETIDTVIEAPDSILDMEKLLFIENKNEDIHNE